MIKIVIIDDNEVFCKSFKMIVEANIKNIVSKYSIDIISCDFLLFLENVDYDIIFLDIDLEAINGIDLSQAIIKKCKRKPLIVFVSSRNDLVFDSLSIQPFYFIRKSNLKNDVIITFELLKKHFRKTAALLTFQYKGRKTSIKQCDIVYIESDFHDLYISTLSDEYTYKSTLKSLLETLNSVRFVRIQKSIVINFDYVKEVDKDYNIILTTGNKFSINRHYKKQVLEELQNYLLLC